MRIYIFSATKKRSRNQEVKILTQNVDKQGYDLL